MSDYLMSEPNFQRRLTVYVAETGCYENRGVGGIYDSPERAIAAHHCEGMTWTRELWHFASDPAVRHGGSESWENDADWDDACTIRAYEVIDTGDLRSADYINAFDDLPTGGGPIGRPVTAEEADLIVRGAS